MLGFLGCVVRSGSLRLDKLVGLRCVWYLVCIIVVGWFCLDHSVLDYVAGRVAVGLRDKFSTARVNEVVSYLRLSSKRESDEQVDFSQRKLPIKI